MCDWEVAMVSSTGSLSAIEIDTPWSLLAEWAHIGSGGLAHRACLAYCDQEGMPRVAL